MSESSASVHTTDVAIIGAGPVGLFAVFECGMLGMRCHVIDSLDALGGQCTALYPEKPIYDIPGFPRVEAATLIARLTEQAAPFDPVYHLGQQVETLTPTDDEGWELYTAAGTRIRARAVIIAAGVGAFGPNRPPLEGLERFEGEGVQYFVKRREDFRDKSIVIAGGGDSALDWAIDLAGITRKMMVVHRRSRFRGAPESVRRLHQLAENGQVELVTPYQLAGLEGDGNRLTGVIVADLDGNRLTLEADVLLPFFGLAMSLGPIANWGLSLEKNNVPIDQATARTSADGIYTIGDMATYPGKLKLILTGFAEAASAAHDIFPRVFPGEVLRFEYSTTKGIPTGHPEPE